MQFSSPATGGRSYEQRHSSYTYQASREDGEVRKLEATVKMAELGVKMPKKK